MLVLKRKRRQKILIGSEIILTVVGTSKNGVRLGIEAPRGLPVLRDELLDEDIGEPVDDRTPIAAQGRECDRD